MVQQPLKAVCAAFCLSKCVPNKLAGIKIWWCASVLRLEKGREPLRLVSEWCWEASLFVLCSIRTFSSSSSLLMILRRNPRALSSLLFSSQPFSHFRVSPERVSRNRVPDFSNLFSTFHQFFGHKPVQKWQMPGIFPKSGYCNDTRISGYQSGRESD